MKADIYVSPKGDDANPGTRARPLATLTRARDAVRALKKKGKKEITVFLRGGTYRLAETAVFGLKDSAPRGGNIIYAAHPGERPILTSTTPITGWKQPDGELPGLPKSARGKVWGADLPDGVAGLLTLYDRKGRLPRARSTGMRPTRKYQRGSSKESKWLLPAPVEALKLLSSPGDAEISIIPSYPWVHNVLPVASVDGTKRTVRTCVPGTYPLGGLRWTPVPGPSMWVENTLATLDQPGEWVSDSKARKLYLWPRDGARPSGICAPRLTELIRVEGRIDYAGPRDTPVRGISFRGLTFTGGDRWPWEPGKIGWGLQHDWEMFDRPTALVRFRGAEDCAVESCRFVNSGGAGVRLDLHCQRNRVVGNEIAHIGGVGVLLAGYGPGTKHVNRKNLVTDNRIHHVGKVLWHSVGIFVWQSGENTIAHNLVHNTPYSAIVVSGRIHWRRDGAGECSKTVRWGEIKTPVRRGTTYADWKTREPFLHGRRNGVELNDIHHVMEGLGDGNCIYVSGTGGGNIVRRNYLHDVDTVRVNANIRCDDDQHETIIDSNLILRCCGEGFISKGRNDITNNVIADLRPRDSRGKSCNHQRGHIVLPYGHVAGSVIGRNVFFSRSKGQRVLTEGGQEKRGVALLRQCKADGNLYFCSAAPNWGEKHLREQRKHGIEEHSRVADPLFVAPAKGDFRLKKGSPALGLGFKPLKLEDAGPRSGKAAGR
jgi:hypothetical protein